MISTSCEQEEEDRFYTSQEQEGDITDGLQCPAADMLPASTEDGEVSTPAGLQWPAAGVFPMTIRDGVVSTPAGVFPASL